MMKAQYGKEVIRTLIDEAFSEGREFLMEHESKAILKSHGIPTTREKLAQDENEAKEFAKDIGFPVVLKICSPEIVHKSDVGGVSLGLKTPEEVEKSYRDIIKNVSEKKPEAKILGVLVQEMAPKGHEVIVGGLRDPQFGPVVMFGMGGTYVEVLKDVSFRLSPLSKKEAINMIKEIKGYELLKGRREEPIDLNALASVITRVGDIMLDFSEVKELDLNPLIVHHRGIMAVDARIILSPR